MLSVPKLVVSRRLPFWHRRDVGTQISLRLPEDLIEYIDRQVDAGRASSRAAVVSRALLREQRRDMAARDAAMLAAAATATDEDDLDALARHAARVPMDDPD